MSQTLGLETQALRTVRRVVTPVVPTLTIVAVVACLTSVAYGYACTGYDPVDTQFFTGPLGTTGKIFGWFSDCYEYVCGYTPVCTTTNSITSCTNVPFYCTATDKTPTDYVAAYGSQVIACGGQLVDSITSNLMRLPGNAERSYLVTASVDSFNATINNATGSTLKPFVACLHAL